VLLERVRRAIESPLAETGKVEGGLAGRLAGDGAGMQRDAADHRRTIDHGHPLAQLGGGDGAFLAGRAAADHHQVVWAGRFSFRFHRGSFLSPASSAYPATAGALAGDGGSGSSSGVCSHFRSFRSRTAMVYRTGTSARVPMVATERPPI